MIKRSRPGRRRTMLALSAAAAVTAGVAMFIATAMPSGATTSSASDTGVGVLAASAGCGKAPTLTSGTHSLQSNGITRSYILRVPDGYDNRRPYRLIFAFHWRTGTAGNVAAGNYYGLLGLANNSAIFVAPQGLNNGWANSGGEDVTFVDNMIRVIEDGLCVETTNRFALGFSYGGGMSYALACARANVFRAVAIYAGGVISGCSGGTQPIGYLQAHGISDSTLGISGARSMRDRFARNNGCTAASPPEPAPGSGTHTSYTYSGCSAGYPVEWYAFDGGHTASPRDAGSSTSWLPGVTWRFFAQFASTPGPTPSPSVTPTTTPPSSFALRSESSGRCLNSPQGATANGTQLTIWDCNGAANQRFTRTGTTLQLLGKCLDAAPNATAGAKAQLWDCNGGANQQWNLNSNGTISNVQNGLCLDVNGNGTANGTLTIVWTCHGNANQRWTRV